MKRLVYLIFLMLAGRVVCAQQNIIFETDMGNDVDDALALDMLYKYADMGKVNLMAVMLNKEGTYPPQFIDLLNTWYGYKHLPIGLSNTTVTNIVAGKNYTEHVVGMKDSKGKPLYKRTIKHTERLPFAVNLYRKLLSKAEDHSVTIVSVGFSTNLAQLLNTKSDKYSPLTGKELVARKVNRLVMMAGHIENPYYAEYNVVNDVPSCQKVFQEWPTSIYISPFELGQDILYPKKSIQEDWEQHHPIVQAYYNYLPKLEDRPTWDLTAVLFAVEPKQMFNVSHPGNITITPQGYSHFAADPQGKHYYLTASSNQKRDILHYFLSLVPIAPEQKK